MYRDELEDHLGFESALATFTRHYANCENRKEQAWKGWLKALECQYNSQEFSQAISQIDYEYFGCDIVFLASAWGGTRFVKAVSPHIAWHQLKRNENMAEGEETSNPDRNNLNFSQEPSFWVWYFGSQHNHPQQQRYDVEYCVATLLEENFLSITHRLPSYSFGHDITLRTTLVAWNMPIEREPFKNIFSSPISDDEAADIVVAYCANGENSSTTFSEDDHEIIKNLTLNIDYCTPYPLSDHFKTVLGTQLNELPLGIVAAGLLMRGWHDKSALVEHIMSHNPSIFKQHLDVLYNICLTDGMFYRHRPDQSVAAQIFHDNPHFHIGPCVAPLLKDSLNNLSADPKDKKHLQGVLENCALNITLPAIPEEEIAHTLNQIFEVFSVRGRNDSSLKLDNIDTWWTNPNGWTRALQWFEPEVQRKINELMTPVVEAGIVLQNQNISYRSQPSKDEDNKIQAAEITLKLFDAKRWNEQTRKLKM